MITEYEKTVMTIPTGKFVWDRALQDVRFIPNGRRSAKFTLVLSVKENNEQDAIAKVCRHLLKKIAEHKKDKRNGVVTAMVNEPGWKVEKLDVS